ncbi:MAG: GTP 3',8-cyclase MoaA [Alphaproteobacteria bacterium]
METFADGFGRRFRYLRISLTEVCNFRCVYCLPNGYQKVAGPAVMTPLEIERLGRVFSRRGVAKFRLTGGEPTVRRDLGDIIGRLSALPDVRKVAMTTNGWNLARHIDDWAAAGLTNLNVSVDSLEPDVFHRITGHNRLAAVLAGVDRALELALPSVKLNAVLQRDAVGDGFDRFADYVRTRPVAVRFIELMRTGDNVALFEDQHVPGSHLREWLTARGWSPSPRGPDDGPAIEFSHPDYVGRLGLIAPYSPGFCDSCNRLRITATGKLRLCLFGDDGVDLRDLLASEDAAPLEARIESALRIKPRGHRLAEGRSGDTRNLAQLGG